MIHEECFSGLFTITFAVHEKLWRGDIFVDSGDLRLCGQEINQLLICDCIIRSKFDLCVTPWCVVFGLVLVISHSELSQSNECHKK